VLSLCASQALPIFLDKLVDPVTAVLLSVSVVLVIGEILPQAVCRSYGLQVRKNNILHPKERMNMSLFAIGKDMNRQNFSL
jgi:CBS domain containing-hemolysin-like protein